MLLENGSVLVQTSQNGPCVPDLQEGPKCVNSVNMIDVLLDKTEESVFIPCGKESVVQTDDEANNYLVAAIILKFY